MYIIFSYLNSLLLVTSVADEKYCLFLQAPTFTDYLHNMYLLLKNYYQYLYKILTVVIINMHEIFAINIKLETTN